ncbi:hypothetical protein [Bacillus sp. FJAT-29937]|uniref:hypothetical protein n=1 Tax=Bacillus sp. FJAT-29937 TaxID=1720553 RepID=UPI0008311D9E|nr:hypothetical protein [Bacillus sp. FJAT-29937]
MKILIKKYPRQILNGYLLLKRRTDLILKRWSQAAAMTTMHMITLNGRMKLCWKSKIGEQRRFDGVG